MLSAFYRAGLKEFNKEEQLSDLNVSSLFNMAFLSTLLLA